MRTVGKAEFDALATGERPLSFVPSHFVRWHPETIEWSVNAIIVHSTPDFPDEIKVAQ